MSQAATVDPHRSVLPVPMGLVTQAGNSLMMVRRAKALAVADHVMNADFEMTSQVLRQAEGCTQLPFVIEDIRVAKTRVLDANRGPVETDRVPAASADIDQLEDPAVGGNDEVSADIRKLMELRVGHVRRERVEDTGHGGRLGNMLNDHVRVAKAPLRSTVVTQRVFSHLALAFQPKRDQVLDDVRPLRQLAKPIWPSVRVRSPKRPHGTQHGKSYEVDALAFGRLDGGDRTAGRHPRARRSIGAPGFEPGTSATQRPRATRLRHAPLGPV